MEVRLIQKGDRGLFISNDGKMLFPDRSWKEAKEGFACGIEIVKDKGTYAFVRGQMMETLPIGLVDMMEINGRSYKGGDISGQPFLMELDPFATRNRYWTVYVKTAFGEGTSIERIKMPYHYNDVVDYLKVRSEELDTSEAIASACQELTFEDDFTYAFEMFKLLRKVYVGGLRSKTCVGIRVYNSSLVIVEHPNSYGMPFYDCYRYVGEVGSGDWHAIQNVSSTVANSLYNKASDIGMDELSDLAMEYHVLLGESRFGNTSFDSRISSKVFEALGSGVVVYAFNMNGYDASWFDTDEAQPYIALVEESFARLESLKHKVSKKGGKNSLQLVSQMNVRGWLFPFEVA